MNDLNNDEKIATSEQETDSATGIVAIDTLAQLISSQIKWRRWNLIFRAIKYSVVIGLVVFVAVSIREKAKTGGTNFMGFGQNSKLIKDLESFFQPGSEAVPGQPHIALVRLTGIIFENGGGSAELINPSLERAFTNEDTQAVILKIDSPGGSPVHSRQIYNQINRMQDKFPNKKIVALINEGALSGGYYVAAAADEIVADAASLVGSIGVISAGFGFTGLLEKIGIDRRVYTSGDNKAFLDPFQPEKPAEVENMQILLDELHGQFIASIQAERSQRLKAPEEVLFSGLFWTGERALGLGLIDGLGDQLSVAEDLGGFPIIDFTGNPSLDTLLRKFFDQFSVAVMELNYKSSLPR